MSQIMSQILSTNSNRLGDMLIYYVPIHTRYMLFTNWGRIGDSYGKHQMTPFSKLEEGATEFIKVFQSKTRNPWTMSVRDTFEQKFGKYLLLRTDQSGFEAKRELKPIAVSIEAVLPPAALQSEDEKAMAGLVSFDTIPAVLSTKGPDDVMETTEQESEPAVPLSCLKPAVIE